MDKENILSYIIANFYQKKKQNWGIELKLLNYREKKLKSKTSL